MDSLNLLLKLENFEVAPLKKLFYSLLVIKMSETGSKPPTRQERKRCWFVRDEYFGCLDTLNINDPTVVEKNPEKATKCLELKKGYEEGCMASWVNVLL